MNNKNKSFFNYLWILTITVLAVFMSGCAVTKPSWEVESQAKDLTSDSFLVVGYYPEDEISYVDYFGTGKNAELSKILAEGFKKMFPLTKTPDEIYQDLNSQNNVSQFNDILNDVLINSIEDKNFLLVKQYVLNSDLMKTQIEKLANITNVDHIIFIFPNKTTADFGDVRVVLFSTIVGAPITLFWAPGLAYAGFSSTIQRISKTAEIEYSKFIRKLSPRANYWYSLVFLPIGKPNLELTLESNDKIIPTYLSSYVPMKMYHGDELKDKKNYSFAENTNIGMVGFFPTKRKVKIVFPNNARKKTTLNIYNYQKEIIYTSSSYKNTFGYDSDIDFEGGFKSSFFIWRYVDNHKNKILSGVYYIQLVNDIGESPLYPFEYDF